MLSLLNVVPMSVINVNIHGTTDDDDISCGQISNVRNQSLCYTYDIMYFLIVLRVYWENTLNPK